MLANFCLTLVALCNASSNPSADHRALVLIEAALLAEPKLEAALQRYRAAVKKQCRYDLHVVAASAEESAAELRTRISAFYEKEKISGVFLIGGFEFARFENAIGERSIFPEYFQDLDGEIRDTNGDGVLDHYDPWVKPGPALELWLATFRPYSEAPDGADAAAQVIRILERGVDALGARLTPKDKKQRAATILSSRDWQNHSELLAALKRRYSGRIAQFGRGESTPDHYKTAVQTSSELLIAFLHSSPKAHHLDAPSGPAGLVIASASKTQTKDAASGSVALDQLTPRARMVLLFACSALDLDELPLPNEPFLANAYLLAPDSACRTVVGAARSIGLESLPLLLRSLGDAELPFPDAWRAYQNQLYDQAYLEHWLGVRGVWEAERLRFNWSYMLYGDPFARFDP